MFSTGVEVYQTVSERGFTKKAAAFTAGLGYLFNTWMVWGMVTLTLSFFMNLSEPMGL